IPTTTSTPSGPTPTTSKPSSGGTDSSSYPRPYTSKTSSPPQLPSRQEQTRSTSLLFFFRFIHYPRRLAAEETLPFPPTPRNPFLELPCTPPMLSKPSTDPSVCSGKTYSSILSCLWRDMSKSIFSWGFFRENL